MKVYRGTCTPGNMDWEVDVTDDAGWKSLNPRHDLRNHSPDGFAWGYGGSGPAQLALALLADLTDDETAQRYYQGFKFYFVAALPQDENWEATDEELLSIFEKVKRLADGIR
jgi:hypothetical protein